MTNQCQICHFVQKQQPETNNKLNFLPIRLCLINVYTYQNPKKIMQKQ